MASDSRNNMNFTYDLHDEILSNLHSSTRVSFIEWALSVRNLHYSLAFTFMTLLNHVWQHTYRYRLCGNSFARVTTFTLPLQRILQLDRPVQVLLNFSLLTSDQYLWRKTYKHISFGRVWQIQYSRTFKIQVRWFPFIQQDLLSTDVNLTFPTGLRDTLSY